MSGYSRILKRIFSFWLVPAVLAASAFSTPLWSADTQESVEQTQQSPPENPIQEDQTADQSETPDDYKADDFKPSEEISEDFPVPLPSDI